jgi:glycosyltransferase involved in cell wall biosynthesis
MLQTLLDDPALARRLGDEARERAREMYSWDAITANYDVWLAGLLSNPRRSMPDRKGT